MGDPDFKKLRTATVNLVRKHKLTRDWSTADREELVQDVLEAMVKALGKGETLLNSDAFLEVLVRNRGVDRIRAKGRREAREVALDDPENDFLEDYVRESRAERVASLKPVRDEFLANVLALIPTDAGDLLRRRFMEGESAKEAAERLGILPAAVDQRVRRAKADLRDALDLDANRDLKDEFGAPHPRLY